MNELYLLNIAQVLNNTLRVLIVYIEVHLQYQTSLIIKLFHHAMLHTWRIIQTTRKEREDKNKNSNIIVPHLINGIYLHLHMHLYTLVTTSNILLVQKIHVKFESPLAVVCNTNYTNNSF